MAGDACRGEARPGNARQAWPDRLALASLGLANHDTAGLAHQGVTSHASTKYGKAGSARRSWAALGGAGQRKAGMTRRGLPRHGEGRQYITWQPFNGRT
jgi:hypothetical protein